MSNRAPGRIKLGEEATLLAMDAEGKCSAAVLEQSILKLKTAAEGNAGLTLIAARLRSLQLIMLANAASTDSETQDAIGYMLDAGRLHEEAVLDLTAKEKPTLRTLQERLVEYNQVTQTADNIEAEKGIEANRDLEKTEELEKAEDGIERD